MKKLSKVVALLLVLAMAFSLCACGNSAKKLYGTWSTDIDLTEALAEEMGDDFADFDAEFGITLYMDFNEDGTVKAYIDEDEFAADMDVWMQELVAFAVEMMYAEFENQGVDRESADALLEEQFGMPLDQYMLEMMQDSMDIESMASEMESNGVFEAKGNKLYIAEDEIDKNTYDIFTVEGDTLTIDMAEGAETSDMFDDLEGIDYPFTFTKVQ